MHQNKVRNIIIHCTGTSPDVPAENIVKWYSSKFGRPPYHILVEKDGTLYYACDLPANGYIKNHNVVYGAVGYNHNSIHIAYVGGGDGTDTRTKAQKKTLLNLLKILKGMQTFKHADIFGHYEVNNTGKTCPNFDARAEYKDLNKNKNKK